MSFNYPIKHCHDGEIDHRYEINLECCGYETPRYVARFCGDWLGQDKNRTKAALFCVFHDDERTANLFKI